jgi:hypothetical protein
MTNDELFERLIKLPAEKQASILAGVFGLMENYRETEVAERFFATIKEVVEKEQNN